MSKVYSSHPIETTQDVNQQLASRNNKTVRLLPAPIARHVTPRTVGMAVVGLALFAGVRSIRQQNG